jgi:integrase
VESPFFFWDRDGRPYDRVDHGFRRACKRADILDFRFHDRRHTFASHLVMRGANLRSVEELLGHKTGKMSGRYTHLKHLIFQVGQGGIEPPTPAFSGLRSTD